MNDYRIASVLVDQSCGLTEGVGRMSTYRPISLQNIEGMKMQPIKLTYHEWLVAVLKRRIAYMKHYGESSLQQELGENDNIFLSNN